MKLEGFLVLILFVGFTAQTDLDYLIESGKNAHVSYSNLSPYHDLKEISEGYYGNPDYWIILQAANFPFLPKNIDHLADIPLGLKLILPSFFTCVQFFPSDCIENTIHALETRTRFQQYNWGGKMNAWQFFKSYYFNNSDLDVNWGAVSVEVLSTSQSAPCYFNLTIINNLDFDLTDPTVHQTIGLHDLPPDIHAEEIQTFYSQPQNGRTKGLLQYQFTDDDTPGKLSIVWEVSHNSHLFSNKLGISMRNESFSLGFLMDLIYQNRSETLVAEESTSIIFLNKKYQARVKLSTNSEAQGHIILENRGARRSPKLVQPLIPKIFTLKIYNDLIYDIESPIFFNENGRFLSSTENVLKGEEGYVSQQALSCSNNIISGYVQLPVRKYASSGSISVYWYFESMENFHMVFSRGVFYSEEHEDPNCEEITNEIFDVQNGQALSTKYASFQKIQSPTEGVISINLDSEIKITYQYDTSLERQMVVKIGLEQKEHSLRSDVLWSIISINSTAFEWNLGDPSQMPDPTVQKWKPKRQFDNVFMFPNTINGNLLTVSPIDPSKVVLEAEPATLDTRQYWRLHQVDSSGLRYYITSFQTGYVLSNLCDPSAVPILLSKELLHPDQVPCTYFSFEKSFPSNYNWKIFNPLFINYVLEVNPADLTLRQYLYTGQKFKIVEVTSSAPKEYLIVDTIFNYALTADSEVTLKILPIINKNNGLSKKQLWYLRKLSVEDDKYFNIQNHNYPNVYLVPSQTGANDQPWIVTAFGDPKLGLEMLTASADIFWVASSSYLILKWEKANMAFKVPSAGSTPQLDNQQIGNEQMVTFYAATCLGLPAYHIRLSNALKYLSRASASTVTTVSTASGSSEVWYVTPLSEYYDMGFEIINCQSGAYLTAPSSNAVGGNFNLQSTLTAQGIFRLRRLGI